MNEDTIRMLADIGLNRLEALIYLHLTREPSVTGYRVAQGIGKPVANVYKALESLQKKDAVVCDESTARRCYVALPISVFLQQLHNQLQATGRKIEQQLANLPTVRAEGGVFRLQHVDQVYERARLMTEEAEEVVLADACPLQLDQLRESFEQSARSGIGVLVKVYSQVELESCHVVYSEEIGSPRGLWPMEWLHLCADGRQHLTALLEARTGRLVHALWCKDTFLSAVAYNGLLAELVVTTMLQRLEHGGSTEDLRAVLDEYDSVRTRSLPSLQAFLWSFLDQPGGENDT